MAGEIGAKASLKPSFGAATMTQGLRQAKIEERTGVTFGLADCGRGVAGGEELVELPGGLHGAVAQVVVELDWGAAAFLAIIEGTLGDGGLAHFLEAESLGAELDTVAVVGLGATAFVFDGVDRAVAMELHDVGDAAQAERAGAQIEGAGDAHSGSTFVFRFMDLLVKDLTLRGEVIIGPELFVVNERALARAEEQVLQRRDGQEIGLGVGHEMSKSGNSGRGGANGGNSGLTTDPEGLPRGAWFFLEFAANDLGIRKQDHLHLVGCYRRIPTSPERPLPIGGIHGLCLV